MAGEASEPLLTWGGLLPAGNSWIAEEDEKEQPAQSMEMMGARLQAMVCSAQAKDAALLDLQKHLQAALEELEQGRAREASLQRRAEVAEAAEEALAAQMGEVEAEAYASITQSNKLMSAAAQLGSRAGDGDSSVMMMMMISNEGSPNGRQGVREISRIGELERRLQAAAEEAGDWRRHCTEMEAEVVRGRAREAALSKRLEAAEAAEEALASQMAELEAEAYRRITQRDSLQAHPAEAERQAAEPKGNRQVAELQRRLEEAERALEAAEAKLRQAEKAEGKQVTVKRKGAEAEQAPMLLSLQELAGTVKLRLWSPSSLALTSA